MKSWKEKEEKCKIKRKKGEEKDKWEIKMLNNC
jgi:hypothetical protein